MSHESPSGGHAQVGHIVPLPVLFATLGVLLVMTVMTVGVTYFDLGAFNIWIALAIAVAKAGFVVTIFMHLKYDRPFNAIILIVSFALIMLFIAIALTDTHGYGPEQIPGYAPKMQAPAAK
jgi:cytochrome c oxidase subunit 4